MDHYQENIKFFCNLADTCDLPQGVNRIRPCYTSIEGDSVYFHVPVTLPSGRKALLHVFSPESALIAKRQLPGDRRFHGGLSETMFASTLWGTAELEAALEK